MGLNFLFVFLVLAGLPKSDQTQRTTKTQKVQIYVSCPASPGSLSMGLNFLGFAMYFLVSLFMCFFFGVGVLKVLV